MTPDPVVGQQIGEAVRELVPPWVIPAVILLTELGNPAVFLAVFAVDYWFGDHRRGAHALALAIGGYALITALKTFFDAPRPPAAVNVVPISGYSFPSGHATSATIGYGILAYDLRVGSKRSRYAVASVLIAFVALSRVILGVHYVRDVVFGVILGTAFVAGALYLTGHDPERGFVVAIALGAAAFVVSGASHDGVTSFGTSLGAALAWAGLDDVSRIDSSRGTLALVGIAAPALGALAYVGSEVPIPELAAFVVNAAVMAGVLVAPNFAARGGTHSERGSAESS